MSDPTPGALLEGPPPPRCWCCHDRRQVLSAEGEPRPCWRCSYDVFLRWAAVRRPARPPNYSSYDPIGREER